MGRNDFEERERLTDEADKASRLEDEAINQSIALARKREKVPDDWDGETCYEAKCGDELPEFRRVNRYFRCVTCQSKLELKTKGY